LEPGSYQAISRARPLSTRLTAHPMQEGPDWLPSLPAARLVSEVVWLPCFVGHPASLLSHSILCTAPGQPGTPETDSDLVSWEPGCGGWLASAGPGAIQATNRRTHASHGSGWLKSSQPITPTRTNNGSGFSPTVHQPPGGRLSTALDGARRWTGEPRIMGWVARRQRRQQRRHCAARDGQVRK
jgi:hypothetical protein